VRQPGARPQGLRGLRARGLPALLDLIARDAEWVLPPGAGPIGGGHGGHGGHEAILAEVLVALSADFAVDDRVIVFGSYRIAPDGEGEAPCAIRFLDVVTMREGYIVRYQSYFDGVGFREALFPDAPADDDPDCGASADAS
jgi:ketosteroid isomerase-like protein